jgi:hypothetical protein
LAAYFGGLRLACLERPETQFQNPSAQKSFRPVEPWRGLLGQIATGGLRYPDLGQRRHALFSLVALCVWWPVLNLGVAYFDPQWPKLIFAVAYFDF